MRRLRLEIKRPHGRVVAFSIQVVFFSTSFSSYDARMSPYLFYDDIARAMRFLIDAFGFSERFVSKRPDGTIEHAQVQRGNCGVRYQRSLADLR